MFENGFSIYQIRLPRYDGASLALLHGKSTSSHRLKK